MIQREKTGAELKAEVEAIKSRLMAGSIDYHTAKDLVIPVVNEINKKGEKVAEKYGKKYYPLTYMKALR